MYNIRNYQNYNSLKKYPGEVNKGETTAQPNQTLSLKELLDRHKAGRSVSTFVGNFEDPDDPLAQYDLQKMDKLERMEMLEDTKQFIKQQKQLANEKANEQIRTERENAIRKQKELETQIEQLQHRNSRTDNTGTERNNEGTNTTK